MSGGPTSGPFSGGGWVESRAKLGSLDCPEGGARIDLKTVSEEIKDGHSGRELKTVQRYRKQGGGRAGVQNVD